MLDKKLDFLSKDHESMIENLNRISDDLKKAKWYFLATMSAIGLAYEYAYSSYNFNGISHKEYIFGGICLAGNIIFWMISEYILSHGFLFRYIQSRAAEIERLAYSGVSSSLSGKFAKDPTEENKFVIYKDDKRLSGWLFFDYLLPDQFLPIYWASLWIVIINTISGLCFSFSIMKKDFERLEFLFLVISLPLIWKLWHYHIHRLKQFVDVNCKFRIRLSSCNNVFFEFPFRPMTGLLYGVFLIGVINLIWFVKYPNEYYDSSCYLWLISSFLILLYFWPVILGLSIHILHVLLGLGKEFEGAETFKPDIDISRNEIDGDGTVDRIVVNFKKKFVLLKWACCLLFHVV